MFFQSLYPRIKDLQKFIYLTHSASRYDITNTCKSRVNKTTYFFHHSSLRNWLTLVSAVFLQVLYTDIHLAVQSLLLNCKKVQATLNECCATCVVVKLKMYPGYILICLLQEFLKLIGHPKSRDKFSSSGGGVRGGGWGILRQEVLNKQNSTHRLNYNRKKILVYRICRETNRARSYF